MEDADADGVPNQYDLDSDIDGLADIIEAGATDVDHNGVIDDDENSPVRTYTTLVPDFDNDGQPDFLDIDSDQDGLYDLVESGGEDLDENGVVDQQIDQNGDGWDDRLLANVLRLPDSDNDGNPDTLDTDDGGSIVLEDEQQSQGSSESLQSADGSDLITGVSGGTGCVLSVATQGFDPTLWMFLMLLPIRWLARQIVQPFLSNIFTLSLVAGSRNAKL